jgi:hypothetical protein
LKVFRFVKHVKIFQIKCLLSYHLSKPWVQCK